MSNIRATVRRHNGRGCCNGASYDLLKAAFCILNSLLPSRRPPPPSELTPAIKSYLSQLPVFTGLLLGHFVPWRCSRADDVDLHSNSQLATKFRLLLPTVYKKILTFQRLYIYYQIEVSSFMHIIK